MRKRVRMESLPEEIVSKVILADLHPYIGYGNVCLPRAKVGLKRREVCKRWQRIIDGCVSFWSRVVLHRDPTVRTASEAVVKVLSLKRERLLTAMMDKRVNLTEYANLVTEMTETRANLAEYAKRQKK